MRGTLHALLVLVLFSAVLAGCGGGDERGSEAPTTTDGTTTSASSTTSTAPHGAADEIVAVDDQGRVVVLDADTGEESRVLLDGVRVDDPTKNAVSVTPDGDHAYVVRPSPASDPDVAEIVRLAVDGDEAGQPEVLAKGRNPAISPDGDTLAYTTTETPQDGVLPEPVLVLRDLSTDEEVRLLREQEPSLHFIGNVAWTADGSQVVFTAGEIVLGLYVVDTDATSLDEARRLGPDARGDEASWRAVTAFGDDRVAVAETCCDVTEPDRWLVVAVNLAQGTVEGGLLPDERTEATWLDSDPGGERLLLVVDGDPGSRTLMRWDGHSEPQHVADGIVVAAW